MALIEFVVFGLLMTLLVAFIRSHRAMTCLTLVHALSYFVMAYVLLSGTLPVHFGSEFTIDALSVFEIILTAAIFALVSVYAGGYAEGLMQEGLLDRKNLNLFYIAINALLVIVVLSFCAGDFAIFWILAELTTFFAAFLIAILNSQRNVYASLKYIFVASTAMLFAFLGLILLFAISEGALDSGTLDWSVLATNANKLPPGPLMTAFALLFIGFAAKAGIAPFHTVLPSAHSKAPSAVSAILSGIIPNIGLYGIMRAFAILNGTTAAPIASSLMITFGVLSLAIAGLSMLHQKSLKKLLGFSTTENAGLMLIGIGIGTPISLFWVLFHTLAHSLTKALLFFSAGILNRQYLSDKASDLKGAIRLQPIASVGLIFGAAAIVGMPPSIVFISELSLLAQTAGYATWLLVAVGVLLLVAAASFAVFLSGIFSHEDDDTNVTRYATPRRMTIPVLLLIMSVFALGIFAPQGLYGLISGAVAALGF